MKKKLFVLVFCFFLIAILTPNVFAESYLILNSNKYFRSAPGGDLLTKAVTDGVLLNGTKVIVLDKEAGTGYGCKQNWYKVRYNQTTGYLCSSGQIVNETVDVDLNGSFEKEMLEKGFSKSYLPYLKALHEKHPNWTFTALKTNLDLDEASRNENIGDISVVDGDDVSLRAQNADGSYIESNEKGWYIANLSTVKYYMDPRNFLSDEYIFMFENLRYNASTQTKDALSSVVEGSFLNSSEYINYLMKAASQLSVSPVYLASRIRQEKGTTGGMGTTGERFSFPVDNNCLASFGYSDSSSWNAKNNCGTGQSYAGIYNFYNIGAYSHYQSAVTRGLIWAKGGFDSSVTTYMRPWDSKEKGIIGGASYITEKFISKGQHTLYLQRFNVAPGASYPTYTHQYMTNVRAHAQEGYKIYKSYKENHLVDKPFEFLIPVYEGLGDSPDPIKPDEEKPVVPEVAVMDPSVALTSAGYKVNNNIITNIGFNKNIETMKGELRSMYDGISITSFKNKYGNSASGSIGTGDFITISNTKTEATYRTVVYGDNNGDGKTTVLDLLRIQKYILGTSNLSELETLASDTNKDGRVNVVDLLRIQKQILGNITIEQ